MKKLRLNRIVIGFVNKIAKPTAKTTIYDEDSQSFAGWFCDLIYEVNINSWFFHVTEHRFLLAPNGFQ